MVIVWSRVVVWRALNIFVAVKVSWWRNVTAAKGEDEQMIYCTMWVVNFCRWVVSTSGSDAPIGDVVRVPYLRTRHTVKWIGAPLDSLSLRSNTWKRHLGYNHQIIDFNVYHRATRNHAAARIDWFGEVSAEFCLYNRPVMAPHDSAPPPGTL